MKALSLSILFALASLSAGAQEFAFAPSAFSGETTESVGGYKKMVAQKVFDALANTRADMPKPSLVLNQLPGSMASFNPDLLQVILDEKAYDVCTTFGKDSLNALAAILAHELVHYYERHDWKRNFARENADLETSRLLQNLEEGLKQETQADYIGGFLAFSVGYNTYGIMRPLLEKLYKAYELPEELPGYPTLPERLKMVDGAMAQLRDLQIVFETANLLTILGQYGTASTYYRHILTTYQSCEIYNNAGVNAALAALTLIDPSDLPYILPLELDPKSRLYAIKNNDLEKEARKNALLETAMEQFKRALVLNDHYGTAYLNKACIHALKAEWEDAEYAIKKGKKKTSDPKSLSDFVVLEGVIAALQNDSTNAVKHWESAKKQGNNWATTNLQTLQKTPRPGLSPTIAGKGLEEIEQFPLADFLESPTTDREVKVAEKVYCGVRNFKASRLFIHFANSAKNYALIQETLPSYTGRTLRGIGMGDGEDKIVAAYGRAPRSVALPSGSVWVYPEANLFFRLTPDAKVSSWGVYRKSDF